MNIEEAIAAHIRTLETLTDWLQCACKAPAARPLAYRRVRPRGGLLAGEPEGGGMRSQIEFALAHPVFDPERQIVTGHYWRAGPKESACLTVNIGME